MLWKEEIANRPKHWVRLVTACNSKCIFCLDMDTPRNVYLEVAEIKADLQRGRDELDAWKVILSGGEATLHPAFAELVSYAHEIGYGRVQTVTNGQRFADPEWFQACMEAGLNEITFSLHGHTAELHDYLTQSQGAFRKLMKGLIRALRDGRPIVNVDVVINKQNVAVLDKIVELCMRVGVTEFDLLHVIPASEAFRRREELFYDPRDHLEVLHKVFRLNRHPRYVIWTNRFPIPYLEGMEDLIQDPHKMLDEVNGRRFHVRRYLDRGQPLDCRDPERCQHCFIEPFCTTMDRAISWQNADGWDVWTGEGEAPFGAHLHGVTVPTMADLPTDRPLYAEVETPGPIDLPGHPHVFVCKTVDQLTAWLLADLPSNIALEVHLNKDTAPFLVKHADQIGPHVRIHQPTWEHLSEAMRNDVRHPRAVIEALGRRVRVSNLPACMAPNTSLEPALKVLRPEMFDENGRLDIRTLSAFHIREGYKGKSSRCQDCRLADRCDGLHVNMIRDQGLAMLEPMTAGEWVDDAEAQLKVLHPEPIQRLENGRPKEPVAPSLPGFGEAPEPPEDPLAIKEREMEEKREARNARAKAAWAEQNG